MRYYLLLFFAIGTYTANDTDDEEEFGDGRVPPEISLYREVLALGMECLWTQKIHVDAVKDQCDLLQRNGIELKKLPQILFQASNLLDKEANKLEQKLESNEFPGDERTEPLSKSLITRIRNFLDEICKFIDIQKTLTPDEVKKMKHEMTIAGEELEVACVSLAEKVQKLGNFLQVGDSSK